MSIFYLKDEKLFLEKNKLSRKKEHAKKLKKLSYKGKGVDKLKKLNYKRKNVEKLNHKKKSVEKLKEYHIVEKYKTIQKEIEKAVEEKKIINFNNPKDVAKDVEKYKVSFDIYRRIQKTIETKNTAKKYNINGNCAEQIESFPNQNKIIKKERIVLNNNKQSNKKSKDKELRLRFLFKNKWFSLNDMDKWFDLKNTHKESNKFNADDIFKSGKYFLNKGSVVKEKLEYVDLSPEEKAKKEFKEKNTNFNKIFLQKNPFFLKYLKNKYTTKFKFKKFVENYLHINLFLYESFFFYKYNICMGFDKALTDHRNGKYLVGFYNKMAIINPSYLTNNFRSHIAAITKLYLKQYMSGFVINEMYNDLIAKGYMHIYDYFELGYFFGNWWKGFFRNFKIFIKHPSILYYEFNFYRLRYPGFVFYLNIPGLHPRISLDYLNLELARLKMQTMMFFDTKHSTEKVFYPILSNNKKYYYNSFYIKIIICICMRVNLLKKNFFLNKVIDKNGFHRHLMNVYSKNKNFLYVYNITYSNLIYLMLKKKKIDLSLSFTKNI